MDFVSGTKQDLEALLETARVQYSMAKNIKEMVAIFNYIGDLYTGLNLIGSEQVPFSMKNEACGHKREAIFLTAHNTLFNKWFKDFINNKPFHKEYIEQYLDACEIIYDEIIEEPDNYEETLFTENDYWEIFFEFTKSLGQTKDFDRYIKNGKIFNMPDSYKDNLLGLTFFNPKDGTSSIFINNFDYNLSSMFTMAHEFGHCHDLGMLFDTASINTMNKYIYCSLYGETLPRLYEKLLLSFLKENNIIVEEVKNKFYNSVQLQQEYLLSSWLFTLLDDKYLIRENYNKLTTKQFFELVKDHLEGSIGMYDFIKQGNFNLATDIAYAYGDILSVFLKDDIDKNGAFNSPLMKDFLNIRAGLFDKDFIVQNELTPKEYQKKYQKQLEQIKND